MSKDSVTECQCVYSYKKNLENQSMFGHWFIDITLIFKLHNIFEYACINLLFDSCRAEDWWTVYQHVHRDVARQDVSKQTARVDRHSKLREKVKRRRAEGWRPQRLRWSWSI